MHKSNALHLILRIIKHGLWMSNKLLLKETGHITFHRLLKRRLTIPTSPPTLWLFSLNRSHINTSQLFANSRQHTRYGVIQDQYNPKTREDEVRLEAQVLDTRKLLTDTIEQRIQKFDELVTNLLNHQPDGRRYDDTKINQYFLRYLKLSNIKNKDWKGFITFQGKAWLTSTKDQLYADATTYYHTHILPHLTTPNPGRLL
jgi:hypothetical protein